jgi:hypothetical protein
MAEKRKRVWSGMANKWVFASYRYRCPVCKDVWGGGEGDKGPPVGERVCGAHMREAFEHLPKKLWPLDDR